MSLLFCIVFGRLRPAPKFFEKAIKYAFSKNGTNVSVLLRIVFGRLRPAPKIFEKTIKYAFSKNGTNMVLLFCIFGCCLAGPKPPKTQNNDYVDAWSQSNIS